MRRATCETYRPAVPRVIAWLASGAVVLGAVGAWAGAAAAQDGNDPAVEAGRKALTNFWEYPWYDAQNDNIRRINVPPTRQPRQPLWSWGDLSWVQWLAWSAIGLLLVLLAYALLRTFLTAPSAQQRAARSTHTGLTDVDRVEHLPFRLQRRQDDLLGEARRCYERGDYDEAIVYLYSYQLIALDRQQRIRLSKGKTNRQYLRELGADRPLAALLEQSMVAFEDVFFGHYRLSRERFEDCWRQVDRFHELIGQLAA